MGKHYNKKINMIGGSSHLDKTRYYFSNINHFFFRAAVEGVLGSGDDLFWNCILCMFAKFGMANFFLHNSHDTFACIL